MLKNEVINVCENHFEITQNIPYGSYMVPQNIISSPEED
jgi:hypothetical protein